LRCGKAKCGPDSDSGCDADNQKQANLKLRFMKTNARDSRNSTGECNFGGRILIDGGTRITRLLQGAGGSAIELF
jgi:hypothetical protein